MEGYTGSTGRRGPWNPTRVCDIHFCQFEIIFKRQNHVPKVQNISSLPPLRRRVTFSFFLRCVKMYIRRNQRNPWKLQPGPSTLRRHLQSGGRRSWRRKRLRMCGLTSSFCSKHQTFSPWTQRNSSTWQPRTSSTRLSRKGTSFSNSLSFLSMNQLSMGIPLESWKTNKPLWSRANVAWTHRGIVFYLIGEGLRWVVDDDGLGEIPTQDVQVFDVVPLDAHAVLTEQPVPEGHSEGTVRGWSLAAWTQVGCHSPDQLLPWIQDVQQLVGVDFLRGREENDLKTFNRQQLKADAFLCTEGHVEGEPNPSPHTSDTCARGTRGKTASVGHKPAAGKEEQLSKRRQALNHRQEVRRRTWYITSWKSTGKVKAASSSSFKLQWTRVSSWQQKAERQQACKNTTGGLIWGSAFYSPDPGPGKTPECCAFSKVALACVLTALLSEEARAWWRSNWKERAQKDLQASLDNTWK